MHTNFVFDTPNMPNAFTLGPGVSVYYVSRLLGHEDLSSTQIYLHPSQDAAIQEAKKVKFFLVRNPADLDDMLRPGFGPGSSARKADMLGRTTPSEQNTP